MSEPTFYVVLAVLGLLLLSAVVWTVAMWRNAPRHRAERLRRRFGPEYDVAVDQYGSPRAARVLEARERRVEKLPLRSLSSAERAGFVHAWHLAQEQFVDAPGEAVRNADQLVSRTMHARGYPVEDFEQTAADLSVDYGAIVQHYRAAHALDVSNRAGRASTEELRQALVHYRALFEELLGAPAEQTPPVSSRLREPPVLNHPASER